MKSYQVFAPGNSIHTKIALVILHWDDHNLSPALDLVHLASHGACMFEDKCALAGVLQRVERNPVCRRTIEITENTGEPTHGTLIIRASHALVMECSALSDTAYQSVREHGFAIVVRSNRPGNT